MAQAGHRGTATSIQVAFASAVHQVHALPRHRHGWQLMQMTMKNTGCREFHFTRLSVDWMVRERLIFSQ